MPIYEYECNKCGERFELRRNMSDSYWEMNPHSRLTGILAGILQKNQ